jgi:hypothetical protein
MVVCVIVRATEKRSRRPFVGKQLSKPVGDVGSTGMVEDTWALERVRTIANEWLHAPERPRIDHDVVRRWSVLLDEWLRPGFGLPIPIRGGSPLQRGEVKKRDGREWVFVDNSPAQWIFTLAAFPDEAARFGHRLPETTEELRTAIETQMPVAFVLKPTQKVRDTFNRSLGMGPRTMNLGYSLHHIDRVAAGSRDPLKLSTGELVDRARRLMDLGNMFVLPMTLRGLGEVGAFIEVMRQDQQLAPST